MRLMCDMKLDYPAMSDSLGIEFSSYFAPELAGLNTLERDGLVEIYNPRDESDAIRPAADPQYRDVLRRAREGASGGVYSRTI